jgi:hypothetical protein
MKTQTTNCASSKSIVNIQFLARDDWEEAFDPAFAIGSKIQVIDRDLPHTEWEEYKITALELIEDEEPNQAPRWVYGVRCQRGTRELMWFEEAEIVSSSLAHLINFDLEF